MAFNLNNYYPKPSTYQGNAVADRSVNVFTDLGVFDFNTGALPFAPTTTMVMFDVQDANVSCTVDGTEPSSTNGHILTAGSTYIWSTAMARAAKFRMLTTSSYIHASELQM
jgi:hypothetical protein